MKNVNKLLVDVDYLSLENNIFHLDIQVEKLSLNIKGKVIINEIATNKNTQITINLQPNSYLIYNRFSINPNKEQIIINSNTHNTIEYNYSFISQTKSTITIAYNQTKPNSICTINVKGLAKEQGKIEILATGSFQNTTSESEYLENLRILTLNEEKHTIIPNLIVDTNTVTASHNATISSLNPKELFYLTTKGLTTTTAKKLIVKGFLLGNYDNQDYIKDITNLISKEV